MTGMNLSIGLLMLPDFQWLDAAGPVDYINNHGQTMLELLKLPKEDVEKGPIITWHYISFDLSPVKATSGPLLLPTTTYANCPALDYLIVPGPDPTGPLPDGCADFLKTRFEGLQGLLLICTGGMAIAQTGILDGYKVCTNKMALKIVNQYGLMYKKVQWVGDRRWVRDGKVWSSAGVTAGLDLGAEFARVMFDPMLVELTKGICEYEPKPAQPDTFAYILQGVDYN